MAARLRGREQGHETPSLWGRAGSELPIAKHWGTEGGLKLRFVRKAPDLQTAAPQGSEKRTSPPLLTCPQRNWALKGKKIKKKK